MRTTFAIAAAALVALTACREPVIERVPQSTVTFSPPSVTTTPKLRSGAKSPSCVNGWQQPASDSALAQAPLDALKALQGLDKPFHPVDLRHFTGPESGTERWYAQVIYTGKPDFLVRFLAVRAKGQQAPRVVAIADYGTTGFSSPDWYGFDGDTGKNAYPGLPGTWPGKPFDYVRSATLPAEVRGCLT